MFCSSCGNELIAGSKFCNKCGNAVVSAASLCPGCGATLSSSSFFCHVCGLELQRQSSGQSQVQTATTTYVYENREDNIRFTSDIPPEEFDIVAGTVKPGFDLEDWLDENVVDPKAKNFLISVYRKVVWVGKKIIQIGKFIMGIILKFKEKFPELFTALILTAIITFIVSMIPLVGKLLAPLVMGYLGITVILPTLFRDTMNQNFKKEVRDEIQSAISAAMNNFAMGGAKRIAAASAAFL